MLNNFQIEQLCKYYRIPLRSVCLKDQLPYPPVEGNYIVNLASYKKNSSVQGTHWTCLILDDSGSFFFDPFGAPASVEIMNYVKAFNPEHFAYNQFIIQDLKTETCGYYCLSLLLYLKNHPTNNIYQAIKKYLNMYDDDTERNNSILKSMFRVNSGNSIPPLIHRLFNDT